MKYIFALSLIFSSNMFAMTNGPEEQKRREAYIEMRTAAAATGRIEWLKILDTPYIDEPDAKGATPLFYACQNGHYEVAKYLVSEVGNATRELWVDLPNSPKTPCTLLHIAAQKGHTEIVKILINDKDTQINSTHAPNKQTPLHYALRHGHIQIALTLLAQKASPFIEDEKRNTPLSLAAKCPHDPALTEAFNSQVSILSHLIYRKGLPPSFIKIMADLLALKPPLEITDPQCKATPLIWSANNGHLELVKLLIDAGANIHAQNKDGLTALDCARKRGHTNVVTILEEVLQKKQATLDKGKEEANIYLGTK